MSSYHFIKNISSYCSWSFSFEFSLAKEIHSSTSIWSIAVPKTGNVTRKCARSERRKAPFQNVFCRGYIEVTIITWAGTCQVLRLKMDKTASSWSFTPPPIKVESSLVRRAPPGGPSSLNPRPFLSTLEFCSAGQHIERTTPSRLLSFTPSSWLLRGAAAPMIADRLLDAPPTCYSVRIGSIQRGNAGFLRFS